MERVKNLCMRFLHVWARHEMLYGRWRLNLTHYFGAKWSCQFYALGELATALYRVRGWAGPSVGLDVSTKKQVRKCVSTYSSTVARSFPFTLVLILIYVLVLNVSMAKSNRPSTYTYLFLVTLNAYRKDQKCWNIPTCTEHEARVSVTFRDQLYVVKDTVHSG
jgi:hypothetical protein